MRSPFPLPVPCKPTPWNKGRLIGQKRRLKPKDVWALRVRLQLQGWKRDLALFNLAIDSKLRGCDLVRLQGSRPSRWCKSGWSLRWPLVRRPMVGVCPPRCRARAV